MRSSICIVASYGIAIASLQLCACSSRSTTHGNPTTDASGATGGSGGSSAAGGTGGISASGGSSGTGGAGASGTGGSSANIDGGDAGLECVSGVLDQTAAANTDTALDRFTTSCGSGEAGDVAFEWTAPATDYYAFDTRGSSFDTVLAVYDGDCSGQELGCNNNVGGSPESEVVVRVEQGQRVVVVVDGQLGAKGDVTLNVNRVTCPSTDLTGQPFPAVLSTVGGPTEHDGACGGAGFAEKSVRWVAETAGLYQFSASSATFGPALYVETGPICGGALLQCNNNLANGYPAQVTRWLDAGEAVTLIIDGQSGAAGEFSLNVEKVTATCPSQAAIPPSVSNVALNDTTFGSKVLSPSCSWAGNMSIDGTQHAYPERSYPVHVNLPNVLQFCTYSITSTSDTQYLLYLIGGTKCEGEEVRCIPVTTTPYDLVFSASDNGDYVLVIENDHPFGDTLTYSITTDCP